jgi:hypothetical protein
MKGKSLKLQTSWECPYKVVTRINDVIYMIQRNLSLRLMVVYLERLAPYQGAVRTSGHKEGAAGAAGK